MDVSDEDEGGDATTNGTESDPTGSSDAPPPKYRIVENVKNDFTEFGDNDLTVHMYVKEIDKDSLKVDFKDTSFSVIFQTA
jgi:hypothetical protein